jgi:hypothetical protein
MAAVPMAESKSAALTHAERGWSVFPCAPKSKVPITSHGFYDATRDPRTIERWWNRNPDANIAAATGRASGRVALDIDYPERFGDIALPETESQATRRGTHHFFRHPGVKVSGFEDEERGFDVKGDGGFVLLAPSTHPTGVRYKILRTHSMMRQSCLSPRVTDEPEARQRRA